MSTADEPNAYELLELKLEATEQEIRTAYRQRSLKVHPDRVRPHYGTIAQNLTHLQNRGNPDAGTALNFPS